MLSVCFALRPVIRYGVVYTNYKSLLVISMAFRLRQLQVIHRHGDRTPLANLLRGSNDVRREQEEAQLWSHHLPGPMQRAQLGSRFSVQSSTDASGSFQQRPFGYLTTRRIEQMRTRGQWLVRCRLQALRARQLCEDEELRLDAVTTEQLEVYSSAYTRTQLSVQSLLDGMLSDHCQSVPRVRVLPPEEDIINTYAIFPEIKRVKAEMERDNAEFAAREHEMAPIKHALMRLFPAVHSGQVPFTWLTAADYFVCRRAHQAPCIPGTETYADVTERHLGFRFHQFYSHRTILKLVAGRLMHNVLLEMQKAMWDHRESKKVVVYSGHDVSLLSVLRTLDADVANDMGYWPEYSSTLALELLENDSGKFFTRTRLNGDILAMSEAPDGHCPSDRFRDVVLDHVG